jgi:hypothetical protein
MAVGGGVADEWLVGPEGVGAVARVRAEAR